MSEQRTRPRGAPWWLVAVLAVALVVGVGLALGLTDGDRAADGDAGESGALPSAASETDPPARDTEPLELPAEASGLRIPDDDPTGLDRERTRAEVSEAADGVGADVATYVDDADRPVATVTVARMDSLPLFTVRRPPEEAADVVVEVRQVGDVRCQLAGAGDQASVVQCLRSEPGLTVSVVPLGEGASDPALVVRLADEVATALG